VLARIDMTSSAARWMPKTETRTYGALLDTVASRV
jgi:hypothetical protein